MLCQSNSLSNIVRSTFRVINNAVQSFVTSHYSTEFLYFPLNQGNLPAGSTHKPKFNISSWDYLDDKVSACAHHAPS